jgi:hypothetical protein
MENKTTNKVDNFVAQDEQPMKYTRRFIKILEYILFCYELQLADKQQYSQKECEQNTSYGNRFEEYLTEHLVSYLQNNKQALDFGNDEIDFEVRDDLKNSYRKDGKIKHQFIDIAFLGFLTKTERLTDFEGLTREQLYFGFEAKRVNKMNFVTQKAASNIPEYIEEVGKFLENRDYQHRFLYEGMIGYIEQIPKNIDKIIADVSNALNKATTTQNLKKFDLPNSNFEYCHLSKHTKNDENKTNKEIYHLFLNYSTMVVA